MILPASTKPLVAPADDIDVLSISPFIANCVMANDYLSADTLTLSKFVYMPVNPLLPPPIESIPKRRQKVLYYYTVLSIEYYYSLNSTGLNSKSKFQIPVKI
jgi:hypothetical protein